MNERNNVLIIHADQHRYDCIGAYGNNDIKTPHIDKLAEDGVIFNSSFCSHPVCTPSRYSLLTGLYVHQHLGLTNHSTLPSGLPKLPQILKDNNYKTTAVGKMHFTPTYLDIGFDKMILAEQHGPGRYEDDYHEFLKENKLCDKIDIIDQVEEFRETASENYWDTYGSEVSDLEEKYHSTTWIADNAMSIIQDWTVNGNMMMLGFIKPHHPFDPPAPWNKMYDPELLCSLPGWTDDLLSYDDGKNYFDFNGLTEKKYKSVLSNYYASISQIDFQIGRIIDLLKAKGLYDNTMIIYTSDHGDYMGYHHRLLKSYAMFEPLVKVPLIVKYPNSQHSNTIDERLVNNIDVAPTVLSTVGIDIPETMDGLNLLNIDIENNFVFAEQDTEYMVRSKSKKLLLHPDINRCMFFDLLKDPHELINLYSVEKYQTEIQSFKNKLLEWLMVTSRPKTNLDENADSVASKDAKQQKTELENYFRKNVLPEQ